MGQNGGYARLRVPRCAHIDKEGCRVPSYHHIRAWAALERGGYAHKFKMNENGWEGLGMAEDVQE